MPEFVHITQEDVLKAIDIIDDPTQSEFVKSLRFKPARYLRLVHRGMFYDSKPVIGIAHGVRDGDYLTYKEVSGGAFGGAAEMLTRRGFFVDQGLLYELRYLNVDETHGKRAPYQYLLLLWAIARAYTGQPRFVPFSEVRGELRELLKPFAIAKTTPDPAMPWAALDNTQYWDVKKPPSVTSISDARVKELDLIGGLSDSMHHYASGHYWDFGPQWHGFVQAAVDVITDLIIECDPAYEPLMRPLVDRLGLSEFGSGAPYGDEDEILEDNEISGAIAPSGRPTRMQDPVLRDAIERRSLDVALDYYKKIGGVDPVLLGKPYDIKVTVDGEERHCEVKGSSMVVDTVELTPNEVDHGKQYGFVDLIVVDGIELVTDEDTGQVRGDGGRCRVWRDWSPRDDALKALIKFAYTLPTYPEPC